MAANLAVLFPENHDKFVISTGGTAFFAVPERRNGSPSHVFCAMKSLFNLTIQV